MRPRRSRPGLAPRLGLTAALAAALVPVLVPGPAATAAATPTPTGSAEWPLAPVPEVVEGFDPPESRWSAGHRGVDLAGAVGQRVRAALGGSVTFAGSLAGRGVVVVDHGGTRTTYEPVAATVAVGDAVAAGDPIGTLQLGGSHCFPAACLHWGLRAGDSYLDPLTLVGAGPVRLLPLGPGGSGWGVLPLGSPATGPLPGWASGSLRSLPDTSDLPRLLHPPRGDAALFRER